MGPVVFLGKQRNHYFNLFTKKTSCLLYLLLSVFFNYLNQDVDSCPLIVQKVKCTQHMLADQILCVTEDRRHVLAQPALRTPQSSQSQKEQGQQDSLTKDLTSVTTLSNFSSSQMTHSLDYFWQDDSTYCTGWKLNV